MWQLIPSSGIGCGSQCLTVVAPMGRGLGADRELTSSNWLWVGVCWGWHLVELAGASQLLHSHKYMACLILGGRLVAANSSPLGEGSTGGVSTPDLAGG